MKKVFKIIGIIFIVIYAVIALGLTICLLNYNDYNITEINGKTFIIVKDNELEPTYKKGDLVITSKNPSKDINKGDKIFFYREQDKTVVINLATVIDKENVNANESTYTLDGDYKLSYEYVIGKSETSKVYNNLGSVLNVLESRLGFLFIIIFPMFVLFIYEIFMVIEEIKKPDEN